MGSFEMSRLPYKGHTEDCRKLVCAEPRTWVWGLERPGSESHLCHSLAVCFWAYYLSSVCLCFFIYKIRILLYIVQWVAVKIEPDDQITPCLPCMRLLFWRCLGSYRPFLSHSWDLQASISLLWALGSRDEGTFLGGARPRCSSCCRSPT